MKKEGGYKYLKQQVVDYLSYRKLHNEKRPDFQLAKVGFEVFINSRGQKNHWCEDWKAKINELLPTAKIDVPELTEQEKKNLAYTRAKHELAKKLGINPSALSQEQLKQIKLIY